METRKFNIKDLDIYGKRIGFFYNNRDKISSYFGVLLSILYIMAFFFLFIFLTVRAMEKTNLKINNSIKYSETVPSVPLNKDNFYFAFGIEDKKTFKRFIDESIYNVSVSFIIKQKINNVWKTIENKELETERCKAEKFSKIHQKLFEKNEFNTSYCIKEIKNLSLIGSYTYDTISYFFIKFTPCRNSTTNSNICKPQNIINEYISGSYATIDLQDIGITPDNYANPIIPLIHNVAVSLDKKFLRELIITKKIVEIRSDNGLITENINTKNYLQSDTLSKTLISRDEKEFYNGEPVFRLIIKLSDKINFYERICQKLSEVLATAGGYMQLFSNFFTVISFLFNRFNAENILVNKLFSFNLKQKKLILKTYKNDKKIFFADNIKKGLNEIIQNFSFSVQKCNSSENKFLLIKNPINQIKNDNKISKSTVLDTGYKNHNIKYKNISFLNKRNNESSLIEINKNNDVDHICLANEKNIPKISCPKLTYCKNSELPKIFKELNIGETIEEISYNWFEYYCGRCLSPKSKDYLNLYKNGKEMLKFQLDIINMFTYIMINKEFIKGIVNSKLID